MNAAGFAVVDVLFWEKCKNGKRTFSRVVRFSRTVAETAAGDETSGSVGDTNGGQHFGSGHHAECELLSGIFHPV